MARRWALSALLAVPGFLRTPPHNYQDSAHLIPKFTAKGAIIEDPTTSASQSTVSPSPPSQRNDEQPPSTPPAQGSPPTPDADGSSTTSSQPSGDMQAPSAPSVQESTQTSGVDRSSATPPTQPGSL